MEELGASPSLNKVKRIYIQNYQLPVREETRSCSRNVVNGPSRIRSSRKKVGWGAPACSAPRRRFCDAGEANMVRAYGYVPRRLPVMASMATASLVSFRKNHFRVSP